MDHPLDLVIVGGGCAGLSLAHELRRLQVRHSNHSAVIIEPRVEYHHDRTWCFWACELGADAALVSHSWPAWRFSTGMQRHLHRPGRGWAYHCIPSERFYAGMLDSIEKSSCIRLQRGTRVTAIHEHPAGARIETSHGSLIARQVIDTRPPRDDAASFTLNQVFLGAEIRCEQPIPEPEVVALMDDMATDRHGFGFTYTLPFTAHHLLVEVTRFATRSVSLGQLQLELDRAIRNTIPPGGYDIVRYERGAIPMGLQPAPDTGNPSWVRAGTAGGSVRAGTGYAYRRIRQWARLCALSFTRHGRVIGQPQYPGYLQWMDRLFLNVLRQHPDRAPELFMALAQRVAPRQLTRFLADQPHIRDLFTVARALPARPFLQQWGREAWQELRAQSNHQS